MSLVEIRLWSYLQNNIRAGLANLLIFGDAGYIQDTVSVAVTDPAVSGMYGSEYRNYADTTDILTFVLLTA